MAISPVNSGNRRTLGNRIKLAASRGACGGAEERAAAAEVGFNLRGHSTAVTTLMKGDSAAGLRVTTHSSVNIVADRAANEPLRSFKVAGEGPY